MTPIHATRILTERQLRQRDMKLIAATMAAVASLSMAGTQIASAIAQPEQIADDRAFRLLKASCKFPSFPGEAVFYAMQIDRTLHCYELK